ncbi:MAG: ATP-binding cassette domain-containing protein [Anaerolineales bacterium]|nr:ATP-binding cassette domain-containing protein [Anaerolineales bacterium]
MFMAPLLRVNNLSKSFGTLPVIQQVSFEIQPGEVVGVTGNIGSGKSVLVMLLAGLYELDGGDIFVSGKRLNWPFTARAQGIGVIHQSPTLAEHYDVVSNIFLGNEIGWPAWLGTLKILDEKKMIEEASHLVAQLDIQVKSLHEKVSNLSGEQRQMIAIARVFTYPVRMVIVDEPTVTLSYAYQQRLLGLIQNWRQEGIAVLFSSNNLDHLFAVTDRIMVLHQGRNVAELRTDETTSEEVVSYLLGIREAEKPTPTLWDFDSFDRIREHAEKQRYHQMLLEKDLAAEDTLNRQLTKQLAEQVQILDQANQALVDAQRRLLSEREEERKRLARELHDQLIQDMLSINYELEGVETEQFVPPALANELAEVRESIRDLVDSLRRICSDLRPPTIDSLGLGAALQSYTREWSQRTGSEALLELDPNLGRLPQATELSIFRIVQEGLNNARRHANATSVQIRLQHTTPRNLLVSIEDNGSGFVEEIDLATLSKNGHFGLLGISERVALLGGKMLLKQRPGGGSLIQVEIPHPKVEIDSLA